MPTQVARRDNALPAGIAPRPTTVSGMRGSYDARKILHGLIDKTIHTLTGRPNTILGLEGDAVLVAVLGALEDTESSPSTMRVKRIPR